MPPDLPPPPLAATGIGIGAGAAFSWVVMLESVARHEPSLLPFSLFASLLLGRSVVSHDAGPLVLVLGVLVNIGASAAAGVLYAQLLGLRPARSHRWDRLIGFGALYGFLLYLVNFQLLSRVLFPWVLEQPQWGYLLGHVLVFGPLLAVMYEVAQRRERERLERQPG